MQRPVQRRRRPPQQPPPPPPGATEETRPPEVHDNDVERLPPRYYEENGHDPRAYGSGYTARADYDDYHEQDERGRQSRAASAAGAALARAGRSRRRPSSTGRPGGPPPPRGPSRSTKLWRRFYGWVGALGVLVLLAGAAWFGAQELLGLDYEDYKGAGTSDVVIKVSDGDTGTAIAATLESAGVVASEDAFIVAAQGNQEITTIQPGYYKVRKHASGKNALKALLDPKARVGQMQLVSGSQLEDTKLPGGERMSGVLSTLSAASCTELNGKSTCVSPRSLQRVAETTPLTSLGVPSWLAEGASKAPTGRELEGLIAPGIYDVKPGWSARQLLTSVLSSSATRYEGAGLPGAAKQTGHSPYDILVIASVIEREGIIRDFPKISRVIYNRLDKGMQLEMDSTINYVLDQPDIRTSSEDRAERGPYNTYQNPGLPPTPISSPSPEALDAALSPAKGPWIYFVKCHKDRSSCFSTTYKQHQQAITEATRRGAW